MATKEEIKKAILAVAGNPEIGLIAEWADKFAEAVYEIDNPRAVSNTKEIRVDNPKETR
jgi:hypothetical protein